MKKPSLKSKLTADKIEAANRALVDNQKKVDDAPTVDTASSTPVDAIQTAQETPSVVNEPVAVSTPRQAKPAPKSAARTKQAARTTATDVRLVRVTIDIPEDLHEELKIKMIRSRQTIKDYLLSFIEKDVRKG